MGIYMIIMSVSYTHLDVYKRQLIALVITIIVLLILASITVTFVLGENGIITKANYAEFATRISAVKEQVNLKKAESKLESITFPGIAYTDEHPYGPIQIWGYETVFGDGWYHFCLLYTSRCV